MFNRKYYVEIIIPLPFYVLMEAGNILGVTLEKCHRQVRTLSEVYTEEEDTCR